MAPPVLLCADGFDGRPFAQIRAGIWLASSTGREVAREGIVSSAVGSAFCANAAIGYGLTKEFSADVTLGIIAARVRTGVDQPQSYTQSEYVIPILAGLTYNTQAHALDSTLHPFVSLSVGPIAGIISRDDVESTITHSEVAFGGRIGAGIEKQLSERYLVSLNFGLTLMSNYAGVIAGRRNFNGSDLSIGFSVLLGDGDEE